MRVRLALVMALVALSLTSVAQPPRFLSDEELPDAVVFLPTPPSIDDRLFFNDWTQYQWGKTERETEAGKLAYFDAKHGSWFNIHESFNEAFGLKVTAEGTPAIYALCGRAISDAHAVNRRAKNYHRRIRPYVQFNEPSLVPESEEEERTDFSYPSGHSSRGWITALVLAEINPAATTQLFKRAMTFAQGRVIVGYHYQSDVEASRLVAMSTFVALQSDPEFITALDEARKEFKRLTGK